MIKKKKNFFNSHFFKNKIVYKYVPGVLDSYYIGTGKSQPATTWLRNQISFWTQNIEFELNIAVDEIF